MTTVAIAAAVPNVVGVGLLNDQGETLAKPRPGPSVNKIMVTPKAASAPANIGAHSTAEAELSTDFSATRVAGIAVSFTVLVYGVVALLVKIDDIGLYLSKTGALRSVRAFGRSLVIAMPTVLKVISVVGTAAMLWVGGSIVIHSLHTLPLSWPYELTTSIASTVTGEAASAAVSWLVTAFLDAVFGFLLGSILIPVVNVLFVPIGVLFPEK